MNNFISRIFVLSLLFSFVYAQDASGIKKGSNDEKVSVKKEQKKSSRDGSAARLNNDDTQTGSGSSASKKAGAGGGGKATPSGNSSRMSGATTAPAPKQGKKAKKGFLGRLLGRSSKKSSNSC